MRYGYGGLTIAQMTNEIRGIAKAVFSVGEHEVMVPAFNVTDTAEDARALVDMFILRADEMGWTIRDTNVGESGRGFRARVAFSVPPGSGPMPDTVDADKPPWGTIVLAGGLGLAGLVTLIWVGSKA